ncbi:MAG: site-2 protease family protein [Oscillochloris sp.]|nr:site-2 protease family protein [Oscillochloris sp.]
MFSTPSDDVFSRGTDDNIELLKAWAGSTLAFAVVQTGADNLFSGDFLQNLIISAIVCGLAFVLHELAHRVVARSYGAEAHFIANNQWLLISIVVAFAGFFIAAPGAVWHRGRLSLRQGGLIALAGPATNMVLSVLFLIALCVIVLLGLPLPNILLITLIVGFKFNAWLGLFNMIPAGPFDGAKVLAWSWQVFAVTVAVGLVLAFVLSEQMVASLLITLIGLR